MFDDGLVMILSFHVVDRTFQSLQSVDVFLNSLFKAIRISDLLKFHPFLSAYFLKDGLGERYSRVLQPLATISYLIVMFWVPNAVDGSL